jgi:hypothetical protein
MKFAFPDEGAFKRFGKPLQAHCPSLYRDGNVVICGKVGSGQQSKQFEQTKILFWPRRCAPLFLTRPADARW